ncbi:universal stress protein [Streptomyces sp. WAC 05977]|uniref:Universal stress protein n=1 Tax=Amycolatopsis keratiniphila TaxID=129921 RepID=R4T9J5_9PSEU|nr:MULTISPECIES: universal stress protein [Amycolatopsis]AGM07208.1 universal stress protein [Amycolatopsis keratiniphila]OKK01364.1 universal stress protein [Amycolatopsis sp. CB00013]RSN24175.1 universal stress protein [Streptomyces sp. WAC 05977]
MTDSATENRIVVGMDGSAGSAAAVRWAADQAVRQGAALQVVTVWVHDEMLDDASADRTVAEARDVHLKALEAATAKVLDAHEGLDITYDVPQGDPGETLVERSKGAALLVLGSHGTGKIRELLVGSVCKTALRHATCPVVVIPPPAAAPEGRLGRLLNSVAYEPGPIL